MLLDEISDRVEFVQRPPARHGPGGEPASHQPVHFLGDQARPGMQPDQRLEDEILLSHGRRAVCRVESLAGLARCLQQHPEKPEGVAPFPLQPRVNRSRMDTRSSNIAVRPA